VQSTPRKTDTLLVTGIQGAFLHAEMERTVLMLLKGEIPELFLTLDPSMYRKYIWESGRG